MKALLICVAVIIGQMNTLQDKQVVHLQPHSGAIRADFGGKLLELLDAPAIIYLPMAPPSWILRVMHGPSTSGIWDLAQLRWSARLNLARESSLVRLCT
jgi:hypothetical protein